MRKISLLFTFIILSAFLFGCSSTNSSSNVESGYYIIASLCTVDACGEDNSTTDDNATPYGDNLTYKFGISYNGVEITDNESYTVTWDFGDGSSGEGLSVIHTYADNGTNSVEAHITDLAGEQITSANITIVAGREIDLYNNEIIAYSQYDRRKFQFVSTAVSGSGQDLKYSWDFDDGSETTLLKRSNIASHNFPRYGATYDVKVTVDNGLGKENSRVISTLALETYLPNIEAVCGSGGPSFADNGSINGQYLVCYPELTFGSVPDIFYTWEYYSEITYDEYITYSNANTTSVNRGGDLVYDLVVAEDGNELEEGESCSTNSEDCVYYLYEGEATSEGDEQVRFFFAEGGKKFLRLTGSSFYYFARDAVNSRAIYLPSNSYLGLINCSEVTDDATGRTFDCSAIAYALPKKIETVDGEEQEVTYAVPLRIQDWSVYDQDNVSKVLDTDYSELTSWAYCLKEDEEYDNTTHGYGGSGIITLTNGEYIVSDDDEYRACYAMARYTAIKYDGASDPLDKYSTMKLDAEYYEVRNSNGVVQPEVTLTDVNGNSSYEVTDTVYLSNSVNFLVERPVIQSVSCSPVDGVLLNYICTAELSVSFEGVSDADVTYYWSTSDGSCLGQDGTKQTINGEQTGDDCVQGNGDNTFEYVAPYASYYDITVYASSPLWDGETERVTTTTTLNSGISGTGTFTITSTRGDGTHDIYAMIAHEFNQVAVGKDNMTYTLILTPVDTNYIGAWDNKTYYREYVIPSDYIEDIIDSTGAIIGTQISFTTGVPSYDNVSQVMFDEDTNNEILAIPLGGQINVELTAVSKLDNQSYSYSETATIAGNPMSNISTTLQVEDSLFGLAGDFTDGAGTTLDYVSFGQEFYCVYKLEYKEQDIDIGLDSNGASQPWTIWPAGAFDIYHDNGVNYDDTDAPKTIAVRCDQPVCIGAPGDDPYPTSINSKVRVYVANGPFIYNGGGNLATSDEDNDQALQDKLIEYTWRTGHYNGESNNPGYWTAGCDGTGACEYSGSANSYCMKHNNNFDSIYKN